MLKFQDTIKKTIHSQTFYVHMNSIFLNKLVYTIGRYAIAGGIGAIIDFGLFTLLTMVNPSSYLIANAISFSLGTICTYYLQKNWTFRFKSDAQAILFTKYLFAVIITYCLNNIVLVICIEFLYLSPSISKIIQIIISFGWGYSINSRFVFK